MEDVFTTEKIADRAPEVWIPILTMINHHELASCQLLLPLENGPIAIFLKRAKGKL